MQEKHEKQVLVNDKLMAEISELQQEARGIKELPQKMFNSLAICKDVYMDILSSLKVQFDSYIYTSSHPLAVFKSIS